MKLRNLILILTIFVTPFQSLGGEFYGVLDFMVSGNSRLPFTLQDNTRFSDSLSSLTMTKIPFVMPKSHNPNIKIYVSAFDGTNNDGNHVAANEQDTVVHHMATILQESEARRQANYQVKYYSGAGIKNGERNLSDAISGASCRHTAEKAFEEFNESAKSNTGLDEIRLVVIGFSRGAATARHFLNLVHDRYNAQTSSPRVVAFAILFDTVSTGASDKLRLDLPQNVYFAINLMAQNERRDNFSYKYDLENAKNVVMTQPLIGMPRIVTLWMPGSHSDIGGSYVDGAVRAYRAFGEIILAKMDLIEKTTWDLGAQDDWVQHDSRGFLDRFKGTENALQNPDVSRNGIAIIAAPMTYGEQSDYHHRITGDLAPGEYAINTKYTNRQDIILYVIKKDTCFEANIYPAWMNIQFIQPSLDFDGCEIGYFFVPQDGTEQINENKSAIKKMFVPRAVINRLSRHNYAKLEITAMNCNPSKYYQFNFLVEGEFIKTDSQCDDLPSR